MKSLLVLSLAACATPPEPSSVKLGGCDVEVTTVPIVDAPHVDIGTPLTWASNPPTSGAHWPMWARWDHVFDHVPREGYVHNLEHGGIVFAYRCDAGCPDTVVALSAFIASLPSDPHCTPPIRHRVLLTSDPELERDGDIVAVAWGSYYRASCVDTATLGAFYDDYLGRAGENTCADGSTYYGGTPL